MPNMRNPAVGRRGVARFAWRLVAPFNYIAAVANANYCIALLAPIIDGTAIVIIILLARAP